MLSVIIPANNEEAYIIPCLEAVLTQDTLRVVQVIVAANACSDRTVELARAQIPRFAARGWQLEVLDIERGGKPNALNRADAAAQSDARVYLDADVVMGAKMLAQLGDVLDRATPVYASGRLTLAPARSWITRAYGRIWARLPFMTKGVPGAGLFAVNQAGRARWGAFPEIISDDTFVRLSFAPGERVGVDAPYSWPLVEGFGALVRVRRRQDQGVAEVGEKYPDLLAHADTARPSMAALFFRDPIGFVVYVSVILLARRGGGTQHGWTRGR